MSGALIASITAGVPSTVTFIAGTFVNNGQDTAGGGVYSVPSQAKVGDTVLFFCLANSMGKGSTPPGSGWTVASGSLGGANAVYVKKMASASDLSASTTGSGGFLAFTVYRGVVSFAVVSGTGFNKSQYHAGVAFFGSGKPNPSTGRVTLNSNGSVNTGTASDILPPLVYANGTNYNQFTAVEFRSQ